MVSVAACRIGRASVGKRSEGGAGAPFASFVLVGAGAAAMGEGTFVLPAVAGAVPPEQPALTAASARSVAVVASFLAVVEDSGTPPACS